MGFWQACALILGRTPDVFSRRRNILYVVGWTLSSPRNTMQKTAYALSWDAALYQPVMGATFSFPISRLISAKEVKMPPPKIVSHFHMRSVASDPAKEERPGKLKNSGRPLPSLGPWCGR